MPASPRKVSPFSSGPAASSFAAAASTRSAWEDILAAACSASLRSASVMGTERWFFQICVHCLSTRSGAPLVQEMPVFPCLWKVVIIFRSESKGSSPFLGISLSISSFSTSARLANWRRASSVGSPFSCSNRASLHKAKHSARRFEGFSAAAFSSVLIVPSSYHCVTVITFLVRVPVLSVHTTLTAPSVSTDGSFLTIVPALTILVTLKASTMVTTAGSPSGTAATASDMAVISISITSRF